MLWLSQGTLNLFLTELSLERWWHQYELVIETKDAVYDSNDAPLGRLHMLSFLPSLVTLSFSLPIWLRWAQPGAYTWVKKPWRCKEENTWNGEHWSCRMPVLEGTQGSFVQLSQRGFSKPWLEQKSSNVVLWRPGPGSPHPTVVICKVSRPE